MSIGRKRKTCSDCPKWHRGWCAFYAKIMVAAHVVCPVGKRLIWNEYMRKYMSNKREKEVKEDGK